MVGCAGNTKAPLSGIHYVADGWLVAAYDKKSNVFLHTKRLAPVTVETGADQISLDNWSVRFVNSGKEDVCAKIEILASDYTITVQPGWYKLPTYSTLYVGQLTQQIWLLTNAYVFDGGQWTIGDMKVVPYSDTVGCAISPQQ